MLVGTKKKIGGGIERAVAHDRERESQVMGWR